MAMAESEALPDNLSSGSMSPGSVVHCCPVCFCEYNESVHRPKLLPCEHTFCKACLATLGPQFDCPICRREVSPLSGAGLGAAALIQTDFRELHLLSSPDREDPDEKMNDGSPSESPEHQTDVISCKVDEGDPEAENEQQAPANRENIGGVTGASNGDPTPLIAKPNPVQTLKGLFSTAMEETTLKVDNLDKQLRGLTAGKDQALSDIDVCFDDVIHTVNRRRQLLRNQVLSMHDESVERVEDDLEKLTFTLMCLQSLKKHSDQLLSPLIAAEAVRKSDSSSHELADNTAKVQREIEELRESIQDVNTEPVKAICFGIKNELEIKAITKEVRSLGRVHLSKHCFPVAVRIPGVVWDKDQGVLIAKISFLDCERRPVELDGTLKKHVTISLTNQNPEEAFESVTSGFEGDALCVIADVPDGSIPSNVKYTVSLQGQVVDEVSLDVM